MTARYRGLEVRGFEDAAPGTYALVQRCDDNSGGEWWYTLENDYPRTNMSGAQRRRGWCGTTNGRGVTACGCVEVFMDAAGRKRIRAVADNALDVDVGSDGAEVAS